jgi:hypothetical protein
MTFLEALRSHRGGIVRLKDELLWYGGRGWDGITGRVCLLLDADHDGFGDASAVARHAATAGVGTAGTAACVLLLIDGAPRWVWAGDNDLELL